MKQSLNNLFKEQPEGKGRGQSKEQGLYRKDKNSKKQGKKVCLGSVAPAGCLLASLTDWQLGLIIALTIIVLIFLLVLLFATYRYFSDRKRVYGLLAEDDQIDSSGLLYELADDGEHYVVAGIGSCTDKEVIITNSVSGMPVIEIKQDAFKDCEKIESVYVPSSVNKIGADAFGGCAALKSVLLGGSKTSVWVATKDGEEINLKRQTRDEYKTAAALKNEQKDCVWVRQSA